MTEWTYDQQWTHDQLIEAADTIFASLKGRDAYLQYLQDNNYDQNFEAEVQDNAKEMRVFNHWAEQGILDTDLWVLANLLLNAIAHQKQACNLDEFVKHHADLAERVAAA